MPIYEVELTQEVTYTEYATVTIEADNLAAAEEEAVRLAEEGEVSFRDYRDGSEYGDIEAVATRADGVEEEDEEA